MEQFEIILVGETLTIHPKEDETFHVFRGEALLAVIFPSIDKDTGAIVWETADLIDSDYVLQIGELIEKHDLIP